MKVRIVIERVVLDGLPLPAPERARMLAALQAMLLAQTAQYAAQSAPVARRAASEAMTLALPADYSGGGLGNALGAALATQVWSSGMARGK
jgi:hypothetical protein